MTTKQDFSTAILEWFDLSGRKGLPWQRNRDPYAIWISEIMLQQTQVATVIPYFQRFMDRFPDVHTLARASIDEVLHLWTGLGYYARGRNIHRAAQAIVALHGGQFPHSFADVCALPGIGRSTAGAILAFAYGQRHPILDGNVKRVLARFHGVAGLPGTRAVEQRLWTLAEAHVPRERIEDYTQAIMDLGATVCRRIRPDCSSCPVTRDCVARNQGNTDAYPGHGLHGGLPVREVHMILVRDGQGAVLLQQRPPSGIWGGLWGPPECSIDQDAGNWVRTTYGLDVALDAPWPLLQHRFTHFRLDITPIPARLLGSNTKAMENPYTVWYNVHKPDARGLATPVKRLLQQLRTFS
ncbi:MAG: A/G-specific adenine glycosylase [Gammaproteobacteria bacterium]|nr:A/G-specific adenine glycosylase [Gammaproteobacteria bacterium]